MAIWIEHSLDIVCSSPIPLTVNHVVKIPKEKSLEIFSQKYFLTQVTTSASASGSGYFLRFVEMRDNSNLLKQHKIEFERMHQM